MICVKRAAAALLCLLLLCGTAFAADYSSGVLPYTKGEIIDKFLALAKNSGLYEEESDVELSDSIGTAYICIDAFSVGGGFVLHPMAVDIYEGENAAELLMRVTQMVGLYCEHGGNVRDGFYVRRIQGVSLVPSVDPALEDWLGDVVGYYSSATFTDGSLGEFDFTDMSGWMYFINGEAGTTSMSELGVMDGDVISLRYTLACGMDIGCASFDEDIKPYTQLVNRDAVIKALAQNKLDYMICEEVLSKSNASQEETDELLKFI